MSSLDRSHRHNHSPTFDKAEDGPDRVCDAVLLRRGKYSSECGSRV